MNRTDDMNSLDSVSLELEQVATLADALREYDAPEMYWDEDSPHDTDFRKKCAEEMVARLNRTVKREGIHGISIAFSEKEYRVAVEALVQHSDERAADLITHLQWFKQSL